MSFTYTFYWWHLIPLVAFAVGGWMVVDANKPHGDYDFSSGLIGCGGVLVILIGVAFLVGRCSV